MKFFGILLLQVVLGQTKDITTNLSHEVNLKLHEFVWKCISTCDKVPRHTTNEIRAQNCAHTCHDDHAKMLDEELIKVGVDPNPKDVYARGEHKAYRELDYCHKSCHAPGADSSVNPTSCVLGCEVKFSEDLVAVRKSTLNLTPDQEKEFMEKDRVLSISNNKCQTDCFTDENKKIHGKTTECVTGCSKDHAAKRIGLLKEYNKYTGTNNEEFIKLDTEIHNIAFNCDGVCRSKKIGQELTTCVATCNAEADVARKALYAKYPDKVVTVSGQTQPQQSGVQQSGTQQSGTQQPSTQQPSTQQPGTQQPGTQQPGTQQPGTQQPGTQQPGTQQPGTQQPGNQEAGNQPASPGNQEAGNQPASPGNSQIIRSSVLGTLSLALIASVL